jgi:putative SOS response-associated peptidase YedK
MNPDQMGPIVRKPAALETVVRRRALLPRAGHPFAESDPASQLPGSQVPNAWFGRDESKPVMYFAGIHVSGWSSVRKVKDGLTTDDLYGFLTTDPNEVAKPVHEKAMPVLLLSDAETKVWMNTPWEKVHHLARPAPDDGIKILSRES